MPSIVLLQPLYIVNISNNIKIILPPAARIIVCKSLPCLVTKELSLGYKINKSKINKKKETEKKKQSVVKAAMMVPHTKNSEMAKRIKASEFSMEEISGWRMKIVEKAGIKLQDMLTSSDPWSGEDCGRDCMLCTTKTITGKKLSQDCTRRSLVYETWCLSCEEEDKLKIQERNDITNLEKKEMLKKMSLHKYVGETARSVFERAFEHQNAREQLHPESHMLRHIIDKHEDQDMDSIKFGIRILKFTRSSFERQILESVQIQEQRKDHHILNSRSEYNRCAVPRMATKIGDKDSDQASREKKEDERKKNEIEEKIRKIRKEKNCERMTEPNKTNKRRKLDNNEFEVINETWGRPDKKENGDKRQENPEKKSEPPVKRLRQMKIEEGWLSKENLPEREEVIVEECKRKVMKRKTI